MMVDKRCFCKIFIPIFVVSSGTILLLSNNMTVPTSGYIRSETQTISHLDYTSTESNVTFDLVSSLFRNKSLEYQEQVYRMLRNKSAYSKLLSHVGKNTTSLKAANKELYDKKSSAKKPYYLCVKSAHKQARLGNKIFMYASTFGLAQQYNHTVVADDNFLSVKRIFPNIFINSNITSKSTITTHKHAVYKHLRLPQEDVCIKGYLQTWVYFRNYQDKLRHHLAINKTVQDNVTENLSKIRHLVSKSYNIHPTNLTIIGVQIRGNDMRSSDSKKKGYQVPTKQYFIKAALYFTLKYPNSHFVIVSDDLNWSKEIFGDIPSRLYTIYQDAVPYRTSVDEDLTVLASCEHTIGSVGTFCWWGAWLCGGEVIMYDSPVKPRSEVGQGFSLKDFFPPEWNLMGDSLKIVK